MGSKNVAGLKIRIPRSQRVARVKALKDGKVGRGQSLLCFRLRL